MAVAVPHIYVAVTQILLTGPLLNVSPSKCHLVSVAPPCFDEPYGYSTV
jgi:hypothetical protein